MNYSVLIVCGLASCIASVSHAAVDDFASISDQLLGIDSMSVSAVVEFEVLKDVMCEADHTVIEALNIFKGSVDYDYDGSDWRLASSVSPGLTAAMNVELIKTGNDQLYIDYNAKIANLVTGAGDSQPEGPFLRIPPLAMYDYLKPLNEDSLAVSTISSLQGILVETTTTQQSWAAEMDKGRALLSTNVDISTTHGATNWGLNISARQSEPDRPFRYQYIDQATGHIELSVELSNYQTIKHTDGSTSEWPMLIQETVYDENGEPVIIATCTVKTLIVNDQSFSEARIASRSAPEDVTNYHNGIPDQND